MARTGLSDAARVARWADAALGPGRDGATPDGKGTLSDASAERAAAELGLTPVQVRADWDTARLAGLIEVHGGNARPGWRLRAWNRDDSAVLRGWVALFDAWSLAYPEPADHEPSAVAEVVSAMPQVLSFLQLSAGPVPMEQLLDLLEQRVTELRTERCEITYGPQPEPASQAAAENTPLAPSSTGPCTPWPPWARSPAPTDRPPSPRSAAGRSGSSWSRSASPRRALPGTSRPPPRTCSAAAPSCARTRPAPSTAPGSPPAPSAAPSPNSSTPPAARTPSAAASPSRRCAWSAPPPNPMCGPWPRRPRCAPTPCCGSPCTMATTPRTPTRCSPARRPPGSGSTPPLPSPTTGRHRSSYATWSQPCSPPCPCSSTRCARSGTPHRAGPGCARCRPPGPGAGQGRTPGRLPGAHRRELTGRPDGCPGGAYAAISGA